MNLENLVNLAKVSQEIDVVSGVAYLLGAGFIYSAIRGTLCCLKKYKEERKREGKDTEKTTN